MTVIPVDQTIFDNKKGNCFAACVASILEVPLVDVPNFCALKGDWYSPTQDWLVANHGMSLVNLKVENWAGGENWAEIFDYLRGCYCILNGKSPRGEWEHSVIVRNGEIVHDPHPSKDGLADYDYRSVDVLVVTTPRAIGIRP